MMSTASIALSGMNAAQAGLGVAGHNIANLATPGFRREQLNATSQAAGGVSTTVARAAEPGEAPEADLVGLIQSKNAFLANLAVFRSSDRMAGTLLDAVS